MLYEVITGVDTFFPNINVEDWELSNEEGPTKDEKTGLSYTYQDLIRK